MIFVCFLCVVGVCFASDQRALAEFPEDSMSGKTLAVVQEHFESRRVTVVDRNADQDDGFVLRRREVFWRARASRVEPDGIESAAPQQAGCFSRVCNHVRNVLAQTSFEDRAILCLGGLAVVRLSLTVVATYYYGFPSGLLFLV